MNQDPQQLSEGLAEDLPEATEQPRKGISSVWVIPIVAALIGGWLVFQSATEEKTVATIEFKNAAGLEAGKTAVKLRNIKIGTVTDVSYGEDLSKVIVTIELTGISHNQLTDTTRFWVIRPRIGVGGISGLDTLLSGAYIEMDPGPPGKPATHFVGLEEPQNYQLGNPGTTYVLQAPRLGSLARGSSVSYRGVQVGKVTHYSLSADHKQVEIEVFIEAPYDSIVHEDSRFWNVSGIDVEVGAKGFEMDMESLGTLIAGGVAFTNRFSEHPDADQAPPGTAFRLYDKEEPEFEEQPVFSAPMRLYFDNGVGGLAVGAPVEFKGLRVGTVTRIGAEASPQGDDILTYVIIGIEPDRLPSKNMRRDLDEAARRKLVYRFMEKMVAHGLRAQLKTGSLLTGKTLVYLDFHPKAAKATVKYGGPEPIFPTAPGALQGFVSQIDNIMARLDHLPLEETTNNLNETLFQMNSLMKSLNASEGGALGMQMYEAIQELTRAARAIRAATEYLARHPEALIKGKQQGKE